MRTTISNDVGVLTAIRGDWCMRPGCGPERRYQSARTSGVGPTPPTCAPRQVVSYRGYTDRQRLGSARGEDDPQRPSAGYFCSDVPCQARTPRLGVLPPQSVLEAIE